MSHEFTDKTGASATVEVVGDGPIHSYAIHLTGESTRAGRADFIESSAGGDSSTSGGDRERVFFHTEVDRAFGGRGLSGLLIRAALSDAMNDGAVVVPVCPLFVKHLSSHGDEYRADGGRFRDATKADVGLIRRAVQRAGGGA